MSTANFSATSALRDRGANHAILYGGNAWTAASSDNEQYLVVDLHHPRNVTRIATQGRPRSSEYVAEYIVRKSAWTPEDSSFDESLSVKLASRKEVRAIVTAGRAKTREYTTEFMVLYSDDGENFRSFATAQGDPERNTFEVPIIAQYLRINPTRWRDRISLRMELETIRFRFKTNNADGVLIYARGSQGDYIVLQLKDNRMLLSLDLGSGVVTSLSVGSLLDDNLWHDVVVSRNRRDVMFSVDRVVVKGRIKGEFSRLNLNRDLYIGGIPNIQEGVLVNRNFTGCLENLYLNSTNFIRSVKDPEGQEYYFSFQKVHTLFSCPELPYIPVTFLTRNSYARLKGYEGVPSLNVSLSFRTYEENGMLIYHKFTSDGSLHLEKGRLKIELISSGPNRKTILDNFPDELFNDGSWHQVVLTLSTNSLVLNVDGRPMRTVRQLKISTGGYYLIAGGRHPLPGFIGCMRLITVDGNYKLPTDWKDNEFCCKDEVVFDSCQMVDRCNPNPCRHSGICKQSSKEFFCDSLNALSCTAYKNTNSVGQSARINIDVDGSGPLPPFPVTCEYFTDGRILTLLGHYNQQPTRVDGFQEPGSFIQDIVYEADANQIEAFLNRSISCSQRLQYSCKRSRLFNTPAAEDQFRPFSWWVSRNNQKMDYWAGALPGSRKCECGILGTCSEPRNWQVDEGDITEMDHLPVKQLRIGDTGTPVDEKEGIYSLDLFNNVVTFRISDATINLPTFDMGHIGDIYFEFKTTVDNAVIMHSGDQLQFQYQAGSGPLGVNVETSYRLADNNWHSVSVERNRKEARIVVDGALKAMVREPAGPVRALHLTSELVIGASVDYRDGYVGCIRALLLNGDMVDLRSYAERGLYGVMPGCMGKCESGPCLNNGTCHERYDGYSCDCRWTAFKGPICADVSEKIRVGFTTTNPKGFLLGLFSNISGEYMTIAVSNSGHLRVVFDFGFERQELIFPNQNFGLGQYHDVRITRSESGSKLTMQVDNYEPQHYRFNVKASADAQFNNIQYMYIGKNESMNEGFIGCISRVEFDDIFPLKLFFQEDGPANVKTGGDPLTEDFCGVEPVTHPPNVVETRPPPEVDEDKLRAIYQRTDSAILGSRYMARHKGEYLTQEDKGADGVLDPDQAVVNAVTGHQVRKKKEWFI
ncbi:hypothetical protein B566_EDAN005283 [Ephemera danica]|nr:hypothetical protein B566_EDAN005283 [Ephemera danica]